MSTLNPKNSGIKAHISCFYLYLNKEMLKLCSKIIIKEKQTTKFSSLLFFHLPTRKLVNGLEISSVARLVRF